ncbi:methyl-accepting chemotaxis protein [Methyloglobulus sp.]|uniref:methyl-accepting chemotaxis protein n=1 Tax=Methyloglobulus sp. TaxID=2518622 RepID=UPI0032B72E23
MKQFIDNLFSGLLLWQKFLILGIIAIILALIPFGFYVADSQKLIAVAQHELEGIKPSSVMQKIVQLTQQHRDLSSLILAGGTANRAELEAKEKEIADTIATMDTVIKGKISNKVLAKDWLAAKQHWQALLEPVENANIPVQQNFKMHTDLIDEFFVITEEIADISELSLDPEADSYFMMRSTLFATPKLAEALGKVRALGAVMLAQKQANATDLAAINSYVSLAKENKQEALAQVQKSLNINPNTKTKLQSLATNTFNLVDNVIKLTEDEVLNKQSVSYDSKAYFDAYSASINSIFDLNVQSLAQLQQMIEDRKNQLTTQLLLVAAGILLLFLFGIAVVYLIAQSITRPVDHLLDVMQKLAAGDNTVRSNIQTFDEVGFLGRQFDSMVNQREMVNSKIQQENEVLNNSIIELLQGVAKLAQKDLTVKVPVAEDVTGSVSDALNLLSDETAKVLNRVVQIAGDVSKVSQQVKLQSDNVISIAAEEKREVEQSAVELSAASDVMLDIAKLALSCNQAAAKAIQNTDKAQQTVLGTVQGITAIRDTIRETEKRIKRLGERSQEIGNVVTIINSIAERTHILALNASMHAASAGEAGRGFAVVANEVQKLAENAREATQQISGLVNNIQVETADTVTTMNDAISQVVQGTTLAQQAGNEMRETRDTTADLVQLVQRIADNSKTQAETSQKLRERALQIQKTNEQTFQQLQEQGVQTERLVGYSGDLVASVGVFTLPKIREVNA